MSIGHANGTRYATAWFDESVLARSDSNTNALRHWHIIDSAHERLAFINFIELTVENAT